MNFVVLDIFPCFFSDWYAASVPDKVAAAHSKAVWIKESVQAVYANAN